jgi:LacI family transcriptional regulator
VRATDGAGRSVRRPTMRDVAALARVSVSTVSRVVSGDTLVAQGRRAQVLAAIEQLHYRPHFSASHLLRRDGRSFTVGLLLHDVSNPALAIFERAIQEVAEAQGYDLLTASGTDDPEREREIVWRMVARRVEGLVIMPAGDDQGYLQGEQALGTVMVFLDRAPCFLAADSVVVDNRRAAARAVAHLLSGGHRHIAYLGYRDLDWPGAGGWTNRERYAGYCEALRRRGVPWSAELVRQNLSTPKLAEAATLHLLAQDGAPTALFTAQASITIGAISALRKLGKSRTTALVGFDDFDAAPLLEPGVTVVAQQPWAQGRLAAEVLFRRLGGDRTGTTEHVVKARLVPRGSGEIPPPVQGSRSGRTDATPRRNGQSRAARA